MGQRINISSGAPWEDVVGYSRAVRIGDHVAVTGTIAQRDGEVVYHDDEYGQTREILAIISHALSQAGATLDDVIRTRIFVTRIDRWADIGRAHGEVFGTIKPATTMVQVSRLIVPEALVEIEADAIVQR